MSPYDSTIPFLSPFAPMFTCQVEFRTITAPDKLDHLRPALKEGIVECYVKFRVHYLGMCVIVYMSR